MPRKIRQLKADLAEYGFIQQRGAGKGSHTKWAHPRLPDPVTLSGHDGDDAKPYQEKMVRQAIQEARKAQETGSS